MLKTTSDAAKAIDTEASAEVADELYKNKNVVGASTDESRPEKREGSKGFDEQRVALAAPVTVNEDNVSAERRRLASWAGRLDGRPYHRLVSSASAVGDKFGWTMALSKDPNAPLLAGISRSSVVTVDIFDLSRPPDNWRRDAFSVSGDATDNWSVAINGKFLAVGAAGPEPRPGGEFAVWRIMQDLREQRHRTDTEAPEN